MVSEQTDKKPWPLCHGFESIYQHSILCVLLSISECMCQLCADDKKKRKKGDEGDEGLCNNVIVVKKAGDEPVCVDSKELKKAAKKGQLGLGETGDEVICDDIFVKGEGRRVKKGDKKSSACGESRRPKYSPKEEWSGLDSNYGICDLAKCQTALNDPDLETEKTVPTADVVADEILNGGGTAAIVTALDDVLSDSDGSLEQIIQSGDSNVVFDDKITKLDTVLTTIADADLSYLPMVSQTKIAENLDELAQLLLLLGRIASPK
jgi:hypothetical protein